MRKTVSCLITLLLLLMSIIHVAAFSDCSDKSVQILGQLKIINGYNDGTFRPDNDISRAEMMKMAVTAEWIAANITSDKKIIEDDTVSFTDVTVDDWFYEHLKFAVPNSIIDGYDDGSFKPNNTVTAAEAIKICLSLASYDVFVANSSPWYVSWMDVAVKYGLISEGEFEPNSKISRGQVAELMYRAINMPIVVVAGGTPENVKYEICDGEIREFDSIYNRLLDKR